MNLDLVTFYQGRLTCRVQLRGMQPSNTLRDIKVGWLQALYPHLMTAPANIDVCVAKTAIAIWNTNMFYEGDAKTLQEHSIHEGVPLSIMTLL
jgi:hypothetical protein